MRIYYSGSDNHVAAVPETILPAACIMLTYLELKKHKDHRGNSRFRRLKKVRYCYPRHKKDNDG